MLWKRHAAVALAIAFLVAPVVADADVAGTGTFFVQYDVTNPPTFPATYGMIYFNNDSRTILGGVPVNLGVTAGQMTLLSGHAEQSSGAPPSGPVWGQYESPTVFPSGPALSFSIAGDYVCNGPTGCNDEGGGFGASFVTDVLDLAGSALPTGSGIAYTSDGYATCSAIVDPITYQVTASCAGQLAINAFGSVNTAASADPVLVEGDTTFFDPATGIEVPVHFEVTFEAVDVAGETTVTATSNAAGDIASNFAVQVGDYHAAFVDVSTTAVVQPPILLCGTYPDANDDGIVDGTENAAQGAIDECQMSLLHKADGQTAFSDVTLLATDPECPHIAPADRCPGRPCIDTAANTICGKVDSLSPSVIAVDLTPPPFEVRIDAPTAVNPFARGSVRVKLFGTPGFHVADVDPKSLAFGPNGAPPRHDLLDPAAFSDHTADFDGDGEDDLVLHFRTPETGIAMGDVEACLSGSTLHGLPFEGCDEIATETPSSGCGGGFATAFVAPLFVTLWSRRRRLGGSAA